MPSLSNFVVERQTASATPVDTTSNAASILAINGCFMAFALIIVGARMYVRSIMLKTVGADDYVIMAAMVSQRTRDSLKGRSQLNSVLVV